MKRMLMLLGVLAGSVVLPSMADTPTREYDVRFDRSGDFQQFLVEEGVLNTPVLRFHLYETGTNRFDATGWTATFYYGTERRPSNVSGMHPISGSVSSNYVDFSCSTNDFPQEVDQGYAVLSLTKTGYRSSYARGAVTVYPSPEATSGTLTLTTNLDWAVYSLYANTATHGPYRGGSGITVTTNADGSVTFAATTTGGGVTSVTDSASVDLTITGQDLTASVIVGGITSALDSTFATDAAVAAHTGLTGTNVHGLGTAALSAAGDFAAAGHGHDQTNSLAEAIAELGEWTNTLGGAAFVDVGPLRDLSLGTNAPAGWTAVPGLAAVLGISQNGEQHSITNLSEVRAGNVYGSYFYDYANPDAFLFFASNGTTTNLVTSRGHETQRYIVWDQGNDGPLRDLSLGTNAPSAWTNVATHAHDLYVRTNDTRTIVVTGRMSVDAANTKTNTLGGYQTVLGDRVRSSTTFAASASGSTAFGANTTASGLYSFAQGKDTLASGYAAHAEGWATTASGENSHAAGYSAVASGKSSYAGGNGTIAGGENSFAIGYGGCTTNDNAFVWGGDDSLPAPGDYYGHGKGTFNINPVGGMNGVWIGESNLSSHVAAKVGTLALLPSAVVTNAELNVTLGDGFSVLGTSATAPAIKTVSGSVGIGTNAPAAKLHIRVGATETNKPALLIYAATAWPNNNSVMQINGPAQLFQVQGDGDLFAARNIVSYNGSGSYATLGGGIFQILGTLPNGWWIDSTIGHDDWDVTAESSEFYMRQKVGDATWTERLRLGSSGGLWLPALSNAPAAKTGYAGMFCVSNEMWTIDSDGNKTLQTSHDGQTAVHRSYNDYTGEGRVIDLDAMGMALQALVDGKPLPQVAKDLRDAGKTQIYRATKTAPPRDWNVDQDEQKARADAAISEWERKESPVEQKGQRPEQYIRRTKPLWLREVEERRPTR